MKTLLDLYEAATSTLEMGIWESSHKDFSQYQSDEKIKELFADLAESEYASLSSDQLEKLVEAFKADKAMTESEEHSYSSFYNEYGKNLEEIELSFK